MVSIVFYVLMWFKLTHSNNRVAAILNAPYNGMARLIIDANQVNPANPVNPDSDFTFAP